MKTIKQNQINEKWYLVDASGKRIGTLASRIAQLLMGKNNALVRNNLDPKTKVIVINAAKIDYTPKRGFTKFYKSYSGFPGGLKFSTLDDKMVKDPTFPIENAVKGMVPKNRRGRAIMANLKVFASDEHPHAGQSPETIDLTNIKF
jgi:large subunit ribosomal protein L13